MSWLFVALLAPALWGISNHIDKVIIARYFQGSGTGVMIVFSSFIYFLATPFILIFKSEELWVTPPLALLMIAGGAIYLLALVAYVYALKDGETSSVIPLFQFGPVINYTLGFVFLGEFLTLEQIVASLFIIFGAILISVDIRETNWKFKSSVFFLMLLASFLFSTNALLFKIAAIESSFWATAFWQYVGAFIAGCLLLLFNSSYQQQFSKIIRTAKAGALSLITLTEVITLIARLIFHFATLLAPLALISVVNGVQPAFVFVYAIVLTLFFPFISKEDLGLKNVLQKIFSIGIMFVGLYLLML